MVYCKVTGVCTYTQDLGKSPGTLLTIFHSSIYVLQSFTQVIWNSSFGGDVAQQ